MRILLFFFCLTLAGLSHAQKSDLNPAQIDRYQHLIEELRCLVCQNQNIAESHAPLAADLREQVEEMILAGKSDNEIREYLVARYGDFVLYRPPFKPATWLLWGGPFVLLILGLFVAFGILRGRREADSDDALDKDALEALLQNQDKGGKS